VHVRLAEYTNAEQEAALGSSARRFFLLTLAAHEADDVGRKTFVAIHLKPSERKPRAGSCGVLKADKAARLVGTTEFGCSMRRNASWFPCPSLKHGKRKTELLFCIASEILCLSTAWMFSRTL
jgi:hypothetical protein